MLKSVWQMLTSSSWTGTTVDYPSLVVAANPALHLVADLERTPTVVSGALHARLKAENASDLLVVVVEPTSEPTPATAMPLSLQCTRSSQTRPSLRPCLPRTCTTSRCCHGTDRESQLLWHR